MQHCFFSEGAWLRGSSLLLVVLLLRLPLFFSSCRQGLRNGSPSRNEVACVSGRSVDPVFELPVVVAVVGVVLSLGRCGESWLLSWPNWDARDEKERVYALCREAEWRVCAV